MHDPLTVARFWSKVDVRETADCWLWLGASGGGRESKYGRFRIKSGAFWFTEGAHRVAWEIFNGEPLGARFACHTCDNPLCVNPLHLYPGDRASNARDAVERKRMKGRGNKVRQPSNLCKIRVNETNSAGAAAK